jgi:hypothetical protein
MAKEETMKLKPTPAAETHPALAPHPQALAHAAAPAAHSAPPAQAAALPVAPKAAPGPISLRELAALEALSSQAEMIRDAKYEDAADHAVKAADALIARLKRS